jgi:hypothetical protein
VASSLVVAELVSTWEAMSVIARAASFREDALAVIMVIASRTSATAVFNAPARSPSSSLLFTCSVPV